MVEITHYTDPACPFAFSAEPVRLRLRWHWGDALRWRTRMIVLTDEAGEADKLATGFDGLQRAHGMPIGTGPAQRAASSEPACRLVVAARLHATQTGADRLLRALRVRAMARGLLDDPGLLDAALTDADLDPADLHARAAGDDVAEALAADMAAARAPSPAARGLDHKLGGPAGARRYSAPSYELAGSAGTFVLPGFNPFEAYDAAVANLAPAARRHPAPESVAELLAWAGVPLATAEVAAITGLADADARSALVRVARFEPVGADGYWTAR